MTFDQALDALRKQAHPGKAAEMARYHKAARDYLGTKNPDIDALTKVWRAKLNHPDHHELAVKLWKTNIHKARVAAAKLLTQTRIRPDTEVWQTITR